jgi:uncharacterized protein YbcI
MVAALQRIVRLVGLRYAPPGAVARVVLDFLFRSRGLAQQDEGGGPMDEVPETHIGHTDRRRLELQELTNAMVRLYKERFGRGPNKARTDYAGPDTLVTTIENSLTPAERNMVALGEHSRLRDIRMFFQHASDREFTETVEQITGRKVRAYVSGIDTERDVSAEVFYLQPIEPVS